MVSVNAAGLTFINVLANPIECDCELLWFKKFLIKSRDQVSELPTCFINVTKQNENNPLIAEEKSIYLEPYKYYSGEEKVSSDNDSDHSDKIRRNSETGRNRMVAIATLPDEQFICALELRGSVRNFSQSVIELKCRVKSFPRGAIRWLFGQRVLDRLYLIDNKKFTIDEHLITDHDDNRT
jgi:hypothetical protein